MKAKEVLQTLQITRPTLTKYVKTGLIKVDSNVNGQYNYNKDSVMALVAGDKKTKVTDQDSAKPIINYEELANNIEKDLKDNVLEPEDLDQILVALEEVVNIFVQLAQAHLLTTQSINKINNIRNIIKKMKGIE